MPDDQKQNQNQDTQQPQQQQPQQPKPVEKTSTHVEKNTETVKPADQ